MVGWWVNQSRVVGAAQGWRPSCSARHWPVCQRQRSTASWRATAVLSEAEGWLSCALRRWPGRPWPGCAGAFFSSFPNGGFGNGQLAAKLCFGGMGSRQPRHDGGGDKVGALRLTNLVAAAHDTPQPARRATQLPAPVGVPKASLWARGGNRGVRLAAGAAWQWRSRG